MPAFHLTHRDPLSNLARVIPPPVDARGLTLLYYPLPDSNQIHVIRIRLGGSSWGRKDLAVSKINRINRVETDEPF